jgi:hypothetical protein
MKNMTNGGKDKLNYQYTKYYSKTEHLAFEMTVLQEWSNFQATHTKDTQTVWQKIISCVVVRDIGLCTI